MPMPNVAVPLARKVPMLTRDMSESHQRVEPLPVLHVNHVSKLPEKMPVLPPISAIMMKPIKVAIHCSRVILMFFTQPIWSFVCFGGVGLSTHFNFDQDTQQPCMFGECPDTPREPSLNLTPRPPQHVDDGSKVPLHISHASIAM